MEGKEKGLSLILLNKKSLFLPYDRVIFSKHLYEFYKETSANNMLTEALKKSPYRRERQKFVVDLMALREQALPNELNQEASAWCTRFREKYHDHSKYLEIMTYVNTNSMDIFTPMVFHVLNIPGEKIEWLVNFLQGDFTPEDVKELDSKMDNCTVLNHMESIVPARLQRQWCIIKGLSVEELITYSGVGLMLKVSILNMLTALRIAKEINESSLRELTKKYRVKSKDSVLEKIREIGQGQPWVQHFTS